MQIVIQSNHVLGSERGKNVECVYDALDKTLTHTHTYTHTYICVNVLQSNAHQGPMSPMIKAGVRHPKKK